MATASVLQDVKSPGDDAAKSVPRILPHCPLKNGRNGVFIIMCILPPRLKKKKKSSQDYTTWMESELQKIGVIREAPPSRFEMTCFSFKLGR